MIHCPSLRLAHLVPAITALLAACGADGDLDSSVDFTGEVVPLIQPAPEARSVFMSGFTGQHSLYGYTVEVKKGAHLRIQVESSSQDSGTVGIFGPYQDPQIWGDSLSERATALPLETDVIVPADGIYLLAFKVPERPDADLPFTVRLGCSGEDGQCQLSEPRPNSSCRSDEGPVVVEAHGLDRQGAYEFDHCEYLLADGLTAGDLNIHPGAHLTSADESRNAQLTVENLGVNGTSDEPVVVDRVRLVATDATLDHLITDNAVQARRLHAEDCVFNGGQIDADTHLTLLRSLVANGDVGVQLRNPAEGLIEDCVIKGNRHGVVFGTNTVGSWGRRCSSPSPPQAALSDPVIRYTDIIDSSDVGVAVTTERMLLQIEHSNIIRNRIGVEITVISIGADSFISRNNFYTNGEEPDLVSYHRRGTLAVNRNYWGPGSGSELSERWTFCDGIEVDTWGGIATTEVPEAGPRQDTLPNDVAQETWQNEQE